jgi:hypothetical protein
MLRRALLTTFVVGGLVAASMGTAGAATVSPSTWAPKFCTAVLQYQSTISQQSDSLSTTLTDVTDLTTGRDQIVAYLDAMEDAATTAKQQLQKAGAPSSPNGPKIAKTFVAGLGASAKLFANAKADAAKLSTTDASAFKTDGKQVGQALSDAAEQLSKRFSGIGKLDTGKKLEGAVKAAPVCAPLL